MFDRVLNTPVGITLKKNNDGDFKLEFFDVICHCP